MNEPAAVESPDATTLDPASARLDTLDYEAYRSERSQPALPGTEPPTEPPATGASAGEPTPAEPTVPDDAPGRDDSGKFTKRQASKHENPAARIAELTAKQRAAEERAEAAERRILEFQSRQEQFEAERARQDRAQAPPETRPRPSIDQFASADDPYLAWQESLVDWKLEQREAAAERKIQERQHQERWQQHLERVNTYRVQQPDWDEVISRPSTPLSGVMMQAIVESQRGPEIAYYLGSHPEVLAQLAAESKDAPSVAAPLMRRYLESVLPNSSPPAATTTGSALGTRHSRAAAPPTPVGNGSPTARDESPDAEPTEAFIHRRNQEEIKRRQMYGR